MIKKEYLDLSERESSYGKVYKVAGPCKLPLLFQHLIFSLVVIAEQMTGAKMYELVTTLPLSTLLISSLSRSKSVRANWSEKLSSSKVITLPSNATKILVKNKYI